MSAPRVRTVAVAVCLALTVGLLGGDTGRREAQRLIAASKHNIWLVGAGTGVNAAELRTLAGDRAKASVVAMDPGALLALLAQIRLSFATQYTLVYGIPYTAAARLGRRPLQVTIRGDSALLSRWRPPLLARPPFAGVADSALLSPDLRVLAEGGGPVSGDRLIVGLALMLVLLSAYAVLWRLSGDSAGSPAAKPVQPAKPAVAAGRARSDGDSHLRRDVVDAPPRSPQDVTNDEAA